MIATCAFIVDGVRGQAIALKDVTWTRLREGMQLEITYVCPFRGFAMEETNRLMAGEQIAIVLQYPGQIYPVTIQIRDPAHVINRIGPEMCETSIRCFEREDPMIISAKIYADDGIPLEFPVHSFKKYRDGGGCLVYNHLQGDSSRVEEVAIAAEIGKAPLHIIFRHGEALLNGWYEVTSRKCASADGPLRLHFFCTPYLRVDFDHILRKALIVLDDPLYQNREKIAPECGYTRELEEYLTACRDRDSAKWPEDIKRLEVRTAEHAGERCPRCDQYFPIALVKKMRDGSADCPSCEWSARRCEVCGGLLVSSYGGGKHCQDCGRKFK